MFLKNYYREIIICLNIFSLIFLGIVVIYYNNTNNDLESYEILNISKEVQTEVSNKEIKTFFAEVKGSVVSPGVYEFNEGDIIDKLIKSAGGFLESAFTDNINLSKKITDEMVVYVYNKDEYNKLNNSQTKNIEPKVCVCPKVNIDSCLNEQKSIIETKSEASVSSNILNNEENIKAGEDETSGSNEQKLININYASLEELMTLNGIGQAKANSIISFRNENGNFQNIQDIKNVSGISDNLYEKIKNYITV